MALYLEYSTSANCSPEHIWQKFQKLEEWAWWNPVISQARWLEGQPWQKGSRFLMELARPSRMTFRPVVLECTPPNKVGWVGKLPGFVGEHWFSFEEQPGGTTLLKQWENFSGIVPLLFTARRKKAIIDMYAAWFENLRAEAEKIAREERART
jgi:hypothetical protein